MSVDTTDSPGHLDEDEEWSDLDLLGDEWTRDVLVMVVGFLLAIVVGWALLYVAGLVLFG